MVCGNLRGAAELELLLQHRRGLRQAKERVLPRRQHRQAQPALLHAGKVGQTLSSRDMLTMGECTSNSHTNSSCTSRRCSVKAGHCVLCPEGEIHAQSRGSGRRPCRKAEGLWRGRQMGEKHSVAATEAVGAREEAGEQQRVVRVQRLCARLAQGHNPCRPPAAPRTPRPRAAAAMAPGRISGSLIHHSVFGTRGPQDLRFSGGQVVSVLLRPPMHCQAGNCCTWPPACWQRKLAERSGGAQRRVQPCRAPQSRRLGARAP